MPIDLNRFIATFFDEAKEHLETIEEQAMALGSGQDDAETLNTIFRAAHSIKGGSGTFGFNQLSEATHEIETLFDGLRKGKGRADAATVRLVLDACDVFKSHLARLKSGQRDTDPAMERRVAKGPRLRHVGILYCGIFNSSPSFLADWLATTPATDMLSASAILHQGVRF